MWVIKICIFCLKLLQPVSSVRYIFIKDTSLSCYHDILNDWMEYEKEDVNKKRHFKNITDMTMQYFVIFIFGASIVDSDNTRSLFLEKECRNWVRLIVTQSQCYCMSRWLECSCEIRVNRHYMYHCVAWNAIFQLHFSKATDCQSLFEKWMRHLERFVSLQTHSWRRIVASFVWREPLPSIFFPTCTILLLCSIKE